MQAANPKPAEKATYQTFFEWINDLLDFSIVTLGDSKITVGAILLVVFSSILLFWFSEFIRKILANKILKRYNIAPGNRQTISTMVKYILILLGLFFILQNSGIDLSALGFLAGAIGVGIGFGLQNITNNFISGLIILFEQPIKVGDRIEVGDINGDVIKISARSTMVVTNDNITIIVPNSQFIDNQVINWSHSDRMVRFNIPVGVSYKEDPQRVKQILLDVSARNEGVLKKPETEVLFEEYGDSSINFNLRVWTSEYINRPKILKSQLYFEIFKQFKAHHIEIPFPQRDLHLRTGFEKTKETTESIKNNTDLND